MSIMSVAVLAHVAPQGFRPGLRTVAPIRGLKTGFEVIAILDQVAVFVLNAFLFFKLLYLKL